MPAAKTFTIRKRQFAKLKGPRYELDCGLIAGRRVRKFFCSREEANEFASNQKDAPLPRLIRLHNPMRKVEIRIGVLPHE